MLIHPLYLLVTLFIHLTPPPIFSAISATISSKNGTLNKNHPSKKANKTILHPYYVTGFVDGEASFTVGCNPDPEFKVGWRSQCAFDITLHLKDKHLLEAIQVLFWWNRKYSCCKKKRLGFIQSGGN